MTGQQPRDHGRYSWKTQTEADDVIDVPETAEARPKETPEARRQREWEISNALLGFNRQGEHPGRHTVVSEPPAQVAKKPGLFARIDSALPGGDGWMAKRAQKAIVELFENVTRDLAEKDRLRKEAIANGTYKWPETRPLSADGHFVAYRRTQDGHATDND